MKKHPAHTAPSSHLPQPERRTGVAVTRLGVGPGVPSGDTGARSVGKSVRTTSSAGIIEGTRVGVALAVGNGETGAVVWSVATAVGVLVSGMGAVGLASGIWPLLQAAASITSTTRVIQVRPQNAVGCRTLDIKCPPYLFRLAHTVRRVHPPQPQPGAGLFLVGVGVGGP